MPDFNSLLQQGHGWMFIPSALLLGALHGLEPGHSKTMMAAFIVAVRGTPAQAVLLGLAATLSHTLVVWLVALAGLYFGSQLHMAHLEGYLQLLSAAIILAVGLWMLQRSIRDWQAARAHHDGHGHDAQDHPHHGHPHHGHEHHNHHDHDRHSHHFHHENEHHDHDHDHDDHKHSHDDSHIGNEDAYQDAHERAHALEIQQRFAGRQATTGQIILFGLTGGLIPCPASITILLICLQLKQVALGTTLVLCFSIGLALTMVTAGVIAALGARHLTRRATGLGEWARLAPVISAVLILLLGSYLAYAGVTQLW